jgi:dTDP-3-amino-3,4,6-trideoxy-alpha-D-glucose transaminase
MDAGSVRSVRFVDLPSILAAQRAELDAAWNQVVDSGRFVLGGQLERFESEYAAWCGVRHAVGVANGLDALTLALMAIGIGPGDEVVVPAHTFVATWLAVQRCGATPVPAEPEAGSMLASADTIAACLGPRTRAVLAVPLYGSLLGMEAIVELCRAHGLPLIEDAAQAHGARSGVARAGGHGIAGCFSFYPSKNLGCLGDGGAVVTDDAAIDARLRSLRNYGSRARYVHEQAGINSRLDELQAALLRVRLPRVEGENARRRAIAARYLERLAGIDGLGLPVAGPPGSHVWHLFVVRTAARDALQAWLAERGCETLVHYPQPVYRMPPFAQYAPAGESEADRIAASVLSLPMHPHLADDEVDHVADLVAGFFRQRAATAGASR